MPKSLLSFGLPELQTRSLATAGQWEDFRMEIEATIRQFEPRLRDVSVELIENAAEHDRTLRFTINAVLMMEGDSEQVIYETSLDPASRRLLVSPPTL
jgi:type VI secretion system protein ImpF